MLGMALVRSLLICTSGWGGGGLAGHLLGVSRAGGLLSILQALVQDTYLIAELCSKRNIFQVQHQKFQF